MTRGPSTFKQQDLVRALKGAKAAGFDIARIVIEKDGNIIITTPSASAAPVNAYDVWRKK